MLSLIGLVNLIQAQKTQTKGICTYQLQNLNVSTFRDGTPIEEAKSAEEWVLMNEKQIPAFCYYKFNNSYNDRYGKIYNYWAIINPSELAPKGWHIPTLYEMLAVINRGKPSEDELDEIRFTRRREYDKSYLPNPGSMLIKDGILPLAASTCTKRGDFTGRPYPNKAEYEWWSGGWWLNTEYKNELIAITVKGMIEMNNVEAPFSYNNRGAGYSVICFKDYDDDKSAGTSVQQNKVSKRDESPTIQQHQPNTPSQQNSNLTQNTSREDDEGGDDMDSDNQQNTTTDDQTTPANSSSANRSFVSTDQPKEKPIVTNQGNETQVAGEPAIKQKGNLIYQTQNLNVETFRDGAPIVEATTADEWIQYNNEKRPAYCYYNFNKYKGEKYGKLYNYWAVSNPSNLVPQGWHMASMLELIAVLSDVMIPQKAITTNVMLTYGGNMCSPAQSSFEADLSADIIQLAGGVCSDRGTFYTTPYNAMPAEKGWQGGWWTSNFTKTQKGNVLPYVFLCASNIPRENKASFGVAKINEGYSVLCFKDYPIDSAELKKQVPVSASKISNGLKLIDRLEFPENTTTISGKRSANVYAYNDEVISDFLTFGEKVSSYIKWGKLSDYQSKPQMKALIANCIQSGQFLTYLPNVDWPNYKLGLKGTTIPSDFRNFDIYFDLSGLPSGETYTLEIPELNIQHPLQYASNDFVKYTLDTNFIKALDKVSFHILNFDQALKRFSMKIKCVNGKYFSGDIRAYKIDTQGSPFEQKSDRDNYWNTNSRPCFTELKNEVLQLESYAKMDYVGVNINVHTLYIPMIDSLLKRGKPSDAKALFDKYVVKHMPAYLDVPEAEWITYWLRHQSMFDKTLEARIYVMSTLPEIFMEAFAAADQKDKIIFKKLYYRYGKHTDELTNMLIDKTTANYYDYLITSLLIHKLNYNSKGPFGLELDLFKHDKPIWLSRSDISLPDASSGDGTPDFKEPLAMVKKAIAMQPNNPFGYLYKALFTGCTKIQKYHDGCTVSDWCSNCNDLEKAFRLDNKKTLTPKDMIPEKVYIRQDAVIHYFEYFYESECVNCSLCFYNICGGSDGGSRGGGGGGGRTIKTGKRGGQYYMNKNGNKTYIRRK